LITRKTASRFLVRSLSPSPSAARQSDTRQIRGFVSPPRDGFTLVGRGLPAIVRRVLVGVLRRCKGVVERHEPTLRGYAEQPAFWIR
jgi:hypothetical protein